VILQGGFLALNSEEASLSSPKDPKDDGLDEVNESILQAFSDERFSSVWQIARRICVPKSTVYRKLVDFLYLTVRSLHWIHHQLSDSQKAIRIKLSIQFRDLLLSIRHQG
jgi:hypothetical protein